MCRHLRRGLMGFRLSPCAARAWSFVWWRSQWDVNNSILRILVVLEFVASPGSLDGERRNNSDLSLRLDHRRTFARARRG